MRKGLLNFEIILNLKIFFCSFLKEKHCNKVLNSPLWAYTVKWFDSNQMRIIHNFNTLFYVEYYSGFLHIFSRRISKTHALTYSLKHLPKSVYHCRIESSKSIEDWKKILNSNFDKGLHSNFSTSKLNK